MINKKVPLLPDSRTMYEHFVVDENILVYNPESRNNDYKSGFIQAKVTYSGGRVAFKVDKEFDTLNGVDRTYSLGFLRPELMKIKTFNYLKSNPEFTKKWASLIEEKMIGEGVSGEGERFLQALSDYNLIQD